MRMLRASTDEATVRRQVAVWLWFVALVLALEVVTAFWGCCG